MYDALSLSRGLPLLLGRYTSPADEVLRRIIVLVCACALILAGQSLPI